MRDVYGVAFQLESMDEPRLMNMGRQRPYYATSKEVAEKVAEGRSQRWVVRLTPAEEADDG